MKTISIVTICYNAEDTIAVTMNSILYQSYQNYEYIIIDGASADKTLEKINCLNNGKAQVYSEPDRGISDAFNKGIKKATGDYILFLNSGDYFLNADCLGQVADVLNNNSYDIVTFAVKSMYREKFPDDVAEGQRLWETSMVPHQGTFVKRSVFSQVGDFNECFKVRMDYDFFSRCCRKGCSFLCVPSEIVYYDANGISSNNHYLFEREGLVVRLLHNENIEENDVDLMMKLRNKNGKKHDLYRIDIKRKICCKDSDKRDAFWKDEKYVIYGAGTSGFRLYNSLKQEIDSSNIIVCDTNKSGQFIKEFNQVVQSVRTIKEQYLHNLIIIAIQNKMALCEVYSLLIESGIKKEKVYIYDEETAEIY